MENISYVAMDVHKESIVMGESREKGKAEIIGEYPNTDSGIKKMLKKLGVISKTATLKICYEAGPCGYALKRILDTHEYICEIVAPSLIPIKSGDRIKTDKRDAIKLARLYRAGELSFIVVPDEQKEAVRDLVRCRDDIMNGVRKLKQQTNHFLIRHGFHYEAGDNWTQGYRTWLKNINFNNSLLQHTRDMYMNSLSMFELQLRDIDKKIEEISRTEEYKDTVTILCAFRGIATLTAMIIISEIVDFERFSNPKELMAYLGVVPREYSSGGSISKGSITKCGNKRVRRALIETSWHYAKNPAITKRMQKDLLKIPAELRTIPIKALKRLNKKYWHLLHKGKAKQKAVVAVSRELIGFIWHSMVSYKQIKKTMPIIVENKEVIEVAA